MKQQRLIITQDRKRCRVKFTRAEFKKLAEIIQLTLKSDTKSKIFTVDFQDDWEQPEVN